MATYVLSDFHGNFAAWEVLRNAITPDDRVFVLGDACDRGSFGVEILLEIMSDSRFTYLVGNHDDFMIRALLPQYVQGGMSSYNGRRNWEYNHGSQTIQDMESLLEFSPAQYHMLCEWLAHSLVYCRVFSNGVLYNLAHARFPKKLSEYHPSMNWVDMERFFPNELWDTIWRRYNDPKDGALDLYITPGALSVVGHTPVNPDQHIVCNGLVNIDSRLGYQADDPSFVVLCLETCSLYTLSKDCQCLPSGVLTDICIF